MRVGIRERCNQQVASLSLFPLKFISPYLTIFGCFDPERIERFQWEPKISPVGEKDNTMPLVNKIVAEDGTVTYEEVDLKTIDIPDDHPVKQSLHKTTEESKRRKEKIRQLETALTQSDDDEEDDEQEPTGVPAPKPKQRQAKPEPVPAPVIDPAAVAAEAAKLVRGGIDAENTAAQERAAALATIVKETGVSKDALAILNGIPDLTIARKTAELIAAHDNQFQQASSAGAGARDVTTILAGASKKLGLPEPGAN